MKVQCNELAGQSVVFAYVGKVQFDNDGIAEIDHPELLKALSNVKGFTVIPERSDGAYLPS
jgi:hypothetical protein